MYVAKIDKVYLKIRYYMAGMYHVVSCEQQGRDDVCC